MRQVVTHRTFIFIGKRKRLQNRAGIQEPALFFLFYGVKWITWVTHMPTCPGLERAV